MPEAREEDMREAIPIRMKPLVHAIPTDDEELRELGKELCRFEWGAVLGQRPGTAVAWEWLPGLQSFKEA
jgi:hypothetical protein